MDQISSNPNYSSTNSSSIKQGSSGKESAERPKSTSPQNIHAPMGPEPKAFFEIFRALRQMPKELESYFMKVLSAEIDFIKDIGQSEESIFKDLMYLSKEEINIYIQQHGEKQFSTCNEKRKPILKKEATACYKNLQFIIKLYEQTKALFPKLNDTDFDKKIFFMNGGVKSTIETLVSLSPVTISKNKFKGNPKNKTEKLNKQITKKSSEVLGIFADFIKDKGLEFKSQQAKTFADTFKDELNSLTK